MKRILLIATLLLVVLALFAACGEDEPTSEPETVTKTFTVTFNSDGGSEVAAQSVKEGNAASKPQDPEKAGYTFTGWTCQGKAWSFSDSIAADMTLDANWTPITYTITYELNGGTNAATNPETYTIESDTITFANPTKTGYDFAGWSQLKIKKGSAENKTVTASWTPTTYTITYELNGGTNAASNPKSYTIESDTIIFENPTRAGYNFTGWDITTISHGSTQNKTVTASWSAPISYSITYELDGGTLAENTNPSQYTIEDSDIIITGTPTKENYIFAGWSPSSIPQGSTESKTVTAQWSPIFKVSGNTITGLTAAGKQLTAIEIPSEIDGVAITSIGYAAFKDCGSLTSITIPNSVTSIEGSAFEGCSGLTSITIPNSVESIGDGAFSYCSELASVTFEEDSQLTSIGESAFSCCALTSVTIPKSVKSIGGYAFSQCEELVSVTFEEDSELTSIEEGAVIEEGAFSDCIGLTSVTISKSVKSIGDYAFAGSGLTVINYKGTAEEWNAITKGDDWVDDTDACTVNYNA